MIDNDLYKQHLDSLAGMDKFIRAEVAFRIDLANSALKRGISLTRTTQMLYQDLALGRVRNKKIASSIALKFYKKQREAYGATDGFEPTYLGDVPDQWLFEDFKKTLAAHKDGTNVDFDGMKNALGGRMAHYALKAVDATIIGNAQRDPLHPKWAFVPHIGACAWCIMIGSRDFDFKSEKTASAERHPGCTCPVVADFDTKNPHLEGYDPEGMCARFKGIAELLGIDGHSDEDWHRMVKEAEFFDREWLRTGKPFTPTYESKEAEAFKAKDPDHPLEFRMATAMAKRGLAAVFRIDEVQDPKNKGITYGYADLVSGVEIKNLSTAGSEQTVDKHAQRTKKKRGFKRVCFDFSENEGFTDERARAAVAQAVRNRNLNGAYMVNHKGEIEFIPHSK